MGITVSVITVSFNSESTIRDTIESVLNQTYSNIEYHIIDGNSKDNTVDIAKSYSEQFKNKGISYNIVSEPDKGIYDAMNKGVRLSTGDIVGIINSDDWYETDAIEKVVKTFEETNFDMMYANIKIIKNDKSFFIKKSKKTRYESSRFWNHPSTFIKRSVYDNFQYKLESIYDDYDLVLRIKKAGYKIVITEDVIANFRFGGISNQRNFKKMIGRIKLRYKIYRNNGYSRLYMLECIGMETIKFILA